MAQAASKLSWRGLAALVAMSSLCACATTPSTAKLKDVAALQDGAMKAYVAGNFDVALHDFQRLTQLVPDNADAWFRLGNVYARVEQLDAAEQAYQQSLRHDARQAKAWHNLGLVRLRLAAASFAHSEQLADGVDPVLQQQSEQYVHHISDVDRAMSKPDDQPAQPPAASSSAAAGAAP